MAEDKGKKVNMAGDKGKKVNGDEGRSERIEGELLQADTTIVKPKVRSLIIAGADPLNGPRNLGTTSYDLVSEEERAEAFVYKMDKTWLTADEVRVEIRWGNTLWVIGQGDEPVKVQLTRNCEMRLKEATASMSTDGVLTVVIPKRQQPRKWYEFTDSESSTIHVEITS